MHAVRRTLAAAPLLCLLAVIALPARGDEPKKESAPEPKEAKSEVVAPKEPAQAGSGKVTITLGDGTTAACREQSAQPFLIRGNWFPRTKDADKVKEGRKLLEQAIKYRTEKYGYFEGFGNPKANRHPPKHYAKSTTFMGMSVQVHEKIIPALKCVEAALKASAAGEEYKPRAMGGIRFRNTYKGVEVSNHVYGIAIDIEPDKNTCCGCVAPWNAHPLCKQKGKTVWERMVMPRSWVETFEKYGFYWLGHDVLEDTMHFEFLGEPDKITEATSH
jgi:D-alanyl-D-alanine carboxypeptidase